MSGVEIFKMFESDLSDMISEKQSYLNLANFRPQLGAFLRHYHIKTKSYLVDTPCIAIQYGHLPRLSQCIMGCFYIGNGDSP
jgi:hypothetical protein